MKSLILALIIGTQTLFANGGSGMSDMMHFIPIGLVFVIFYFLLIRPQQKKAKAHQDMLKTLRSGDHVVTAGGILGTVDKVSENEVSVEIANNVKVRIIKATVTEVLSKTKSAAEATKSASTPALKLAPKKVSPAKPKAKAKIAPNKVKPTKSKPAMKKIAKPVTKPVNKKKKKSKK